MILLQLYFQPSLVDDRAEGADDVIRGLFHSTCMGSDNHVTEEIQHKLFSMSHPFGNGIDLIALNIQRGRDHGIPGRDLSQNNIILTSCTSMMSI